MGMHDDGNQEGDEETSKDSTESFDEECVICGRWGPETLLKFSGQ